MKKIFTLILLISLISCTSKKIVQKDYLELKIENKYVKNNSKLKVVLANNTTTNYYLMLDTLSFREKYAPFEASKFLYMINIELTDSLNEQKQFELVDYGCYDNEYNFKNNKISTNRLLKVESGKKIYFYLPFELKTKINNYCWYGYNENELNNNIQHYIRIRYIKPNEYVKNELSQKVIDTLKQNGFKLYDKEIISNKVPILFNK